MKWELATADHPCGCCSAKIERGDPVLKVSAAQLSRCVACAKRVYRTVPPDDLEPLPPRAAPVSQPVFSTTAKLARDFKLAQAGKDK